MSDIENKIRQYGQKRNQDALQQFVAKLNVSELTSLIVKRLNSPYFEHVWDYLMQAFTDSSESHNKRFSVTSTLLHELENGVLSSSQCNALITRLCTELPKFKPQHLIDMCNFCIECIQKGNVSEMCWKDVLPELLNVLVKCKCVEYNDTEMTGLEYKNQLINSLCMLVWSPSILTSLASMFIEMPLTKEEHLQVVNKLGQYMEKLTCQEIPAFVYQLLKLCRYQNCRSIFLRLQYYFGTRIYSKINLNEDLNSDSNNMDVIGDATEEEAVEVESTVLYHIYQSTSVDSEIIKDYLASLKNMIKSPEFILHPFQFTVLLTISSVSACEERVMEILRSCISRTLQEEQKKTESSWFMEMVPSSCKVTDILRQIIDCSVADRHLVIEGLIRLAYILLGVGAMLGRDGDVIAEKQWLLGKMIILKIIKKKRQIAPCIIKSLSDRIVTGQNVYQYIDCVRILSQNMSLILLENQSCVIQLIEYLVEIPGPVANQLFDAILPLTKVSPTIRDHLILLLRKSLYSRVMETRQMAVSGFLKLIKNLKISNLAALSQSSSSSGRSSSSHSLLTQVSLSCTRNMTTSAFSNEALCLEVLGILRRCFMQQAEVRSQLYDGLYDAVCMNPELGIPVLEMMWIHFNKFYVADEESLPPLHFSKITVTKDLEVKQEEPLGKLIYAVGLIVTKVQEEDNDNSTVVLFTNALESLCSRMISCELINFELDDGTDLLDVLPESQHKLIVLKEAISVCEALIGYKICSWGPQSENNGQQINNLFQSYTRLLDFSKNLTKPRKNDKKKKKDDSRTTQQSQNTTKVDTSNKNSRTFKLPNTVLDFQTIGKILHLLHETQVSWASAVQANIIKTKQDIHRHMMQAAIQLVQKLKSMKTAELQHTKIYFNYISEIAGILYIRCIARLNEFVDFDCTTAVLALECFHLILVVICTHYRTQLPIFLSVVAGKSKDEEFPKLLTIFIETYEQLFELDENEASLDPEVRKLPLLIINTVALLASHIPANSNALSMQLSDWLKNVMNNSTLANKPVISSFVSLTFNVQIKFKTTVNLFESVALRLSDILGTINEDKPETTKPKMIDDTTALTIFPLFCNSMKIILDDIDWIILRLRAEYAMINYPGEDNPERRREYLKSKERGVCCHLSPIITILSIFCNITAPIGNLSETLLKNISHLYNLLNSLTKYFIMRSSRINLVFSGARFEHIVKLAGKQLSGVVYDYIIYIEEYHKQVENSSQAKKKSTDSTTLKSKVLRETRLIPKVVFEIEQFGKSVIQLSKKTKVDLAKFIGQGTARDFRIKKLKEVLEQAADEHDVTNEESVNENVSMESEATDISSEKDNVESDEETTEPPHKKSKK